MVMAIVAAYEVTRLKACFGEIYFLRVRLTAEPKIPAKASYTRRLKRPMLPMREASVELSKYLQGLSITSANQMYGVSRDNEVFGLHHDRVLRSKFGATTRVLK
jgi:hypothetical protein